MKFSQLFFYNNHFERNNENFELIDLMRKACFVHQDSSGIFSWLSLGFILEQKVEKIIQEELEEIGFSQVRLSLMQDTKLWEETERINSYGAELFRLKNRKNQEFVLGATCEESITNIVRNHYNHVSVLNLNVFQFGNKYRDEIRARSGLVRAKEFIMKDAYSFCSSSEILEQNYSAVRAAYCRIFERLGLRYSIEASDTGEIGGKSSEEFICDSQYGEDGKLELAHIFNLGQEYSQKMGLMNGMKENIHMACYGIGVSRLVMALLEQQRDKFGFWGSKEFNTYDIVISVLDYKNHEQLGMDLYKHFKQKGYNVLIDDRDIQAGKKMADCELIACQKRFIISKQGIEKHQIEVLDRKSMNKTFISLEDIKNFTLD